MFISVCVLPYFMKEIRIVFDDEEHKQLFKKKGDMTWKEYLMRD